MRTTVTLDDDLATYVDDQRPQPDASDAEAVRECIRRSQRLRERVAELEATRDELQETIDDLETDVDRLQNEKRLILEDREEKQDLVRYVEEERSEQQRWRQAGLATRLKWRLTGMPGDDSLEE